jgi:predicted transposase/invertase (TIGR01784 family)
MAQELLSPLMDYVFSLLFGDQRNIGILKGFLSSLLDIPKDEYDGLTIVNPILKRFFRKDKSGIVDIRINTTSGRVLHIELQVEKFSRMRNRILYYASKLLWEQLKRGDEYNQIHQVISIVICDHELLEEEDSYLNVYELRNKGNRQFTDLIKVIILELPKLPETEDQAAVWPWLKFLKGQNREEMEMLAKKHPEVKEAVRTLAKLSLSEQWRMIREERALHRTDIRMMKEYAWTSGLAEGNAAGKAVGLAEGKAVGLAEGKAAGLAEGLAKGKNESTLETAGRMKKDGVPANLIAKYTGLGLGEIEKL